MESYWTVKKIARSKQKDIRRSFGKARVEKHAVAIKRSQSLDLTPQGGCYWRANGKKCRMFFWNLAGTRGEGGRGRGEMIIQTKIFLTKMQGHPNLFVTGEFLHSQYRNKEKNSEETEDLLLYRQIFIRSVFVRTIFDWPFSLFSSQINCKSKGSQKLEYSQYNEFCQSWNDRIIDNMQ